MFSHIKELFTRPSGYTIGKSVRLRSSASGNFSRTLSAGTRTTWTWSTWVKRGVFGAYKSLFTTNDGVNNSTEFFFNTDDTLKFREYAAGAGGYTAELYTTQVFRDPSAWYHIVIVWDSNNGTSGDRVRLYINGTRVTAFSTASYPTSGRQTFFNSAYLTYIGLNSSSTFDGYLTEINFIDGQALTPSSFGETDSITGVWKAKKYSGTYGTNGFYLNFSDNSSNTATTIGKDYSGNGNNWTPNNISVTAGVTYDSMVDSPTVSAVSSNYATLNPLAVGSSGTLSDGSLKIAGVNSTNVGASYSTIGMTTGKWYFEVTAVGVGSNFTYALVEDVVDTSALNVSGAIFAGYRSTGDTYGTVVIATTTWNSAGVVIGVAVDCDNGAIYFANANTWINSGVPTSGASRTGAITTYTAGTKTLHGGVGCYQNSSQSAAINFGQRPFTYTPPTGFVALNTYNLPASTITNGAAYMAATTYSGDGTNPRTITNSVNNIGFQPDFIWAKVRSTTYSNTLYDSVRGGANALFSDTTAAESTNYVNGQILAFNSNGFNVNAGVVLNQSGQTYVTWQWKAGGTSSSNTNGSITSTVSVGATQGFSVVTYTGTGANATVGHGLGVAPSMIIVKKRSGANAWFVGATPAGWNKYLLLNTTDASATDPGTVWQTTAPTSSVFYLGTTGEVNANTATFVAYCFSAVAGYSAFGSYTGNGSSDGPFVYTGFRPRFFMIKRTDTTTNWIMYDTTRMPYNTNPVGPIYANLSNAEETNITLTAFDILSNGFKPRNTSSWAESNASGGTYIYMAFAEVGFKSALAR